MDSAVSRNERSEELGISVGCRSVDGVDREESVDGSVEPIPVLERADSRTSDFFKILDVGSIALPVQILLAPNLLKQGPITSSMYYDIICAL